MTSSPYATYRLADACLVLSFLTALVFNEFGWGPFLGFLVGMVVSVAGFAAMQAYVEAAEESQK